MSEDARPVVQTPWAYARLGMLCVMTVVLGSLVGAAFGWWAGTLFIVVWSPVTGYWLRRWEERRRERRIWNKIQGQWTEDQL